MIGLVQCSGIRWWFCFVIANFAMETGRIAIEQIVPGLETDVARCSKGAVVRGADLSAKTDVDW